MQVHFKKNASLKFKNRIRISGLFFTGVFIEKHRVFCKLVKVQKTGESTKNWFFIAGLKTD
jgi:hypothetical protein